jgi:hypothetical protein
MIIRTFVHVSLTIKEKNMSQQSGFGFDQLIDAIDQARQGFLKHIEGITADQAVWKPYPGCKSIAETVDHLLWGETTMLEIMQSGKEPDYTTVPDSPPSDSIAALKVKLADIHSQFLEYLRKTYPTAPLDTPVNFWGHQVSLGYALAAIPNEDSYHSGQAAFIRMATDPKWDYYSHIYG